MKQVSYSGKYSLSASRAYQSDLQFSFVVRVLSVHTFYICKYLIIVEKASLQKRVVDEIDDTLLAEREYLPL